MDIHTITAELTAGMEAARTGAKEQAQRCFRRVLEIDPRNETAWLCLSNVMPTTEQALYCIEQLLTINPQHSRAKEAHEVLRVRLLVEEVAVFQRNAPPPSTPKRRYLLGEALVEAGMISPQQLEQALKYQADYAQKQKTRRFSLVRVLESILVRVGLLEEQQPLRLGDILVRHKMVQRSELEAVLTAQVENLSLTTPITGLGHIGQYLVKHGYITSSQLHQALARQAESRQKKKDQAPLLGEVLVKLGYLEQDQLTQALVQWHQEFESAFK